MSTSSRIEPGLVVQTLRNPRPSLTNCVSFWGLVSVSMGKRINAYSSVFRLSPSTVSRLCLRQGMCYCPELSLGGSLILTPPSRSQYSPPKALCSAKPLP